MASATRFVLLPPARVALAGEIAAAGAVVVVDCVSDVVDVPAGAWVRVRTAVDAPGTGPILAQGGSPHPSRPTWLERIEGMPAGNGFAGTYLRGLGSGGHAGPDDVREWAVSLAGHGPLLLDWPYPPDVPIPDVAGIVLSDVLAALWPLPPPLRTRLERIVAADFRRAHETNFVASLASPAYRRISAGEPAADVARGLWRSGDAFEHAWLGGTGLLHAIVVERRYRTLGRTLAAYAPAQAGAGSARGVASVIPLGSAPPAPDVDIGAHEPVAIIGLGCRFPRSASAAGLWTNLVGGFDGIAEVPHGRWNPALYWDPDKSVPDKTYAKIGGFVTDFVFNPRRFRIPPSVARLVDPIQQMALEAAADAMDDAGYGETRQFDRARVATILGNSMGGEITDEYTLRVMFPALRAALGEVPGFAVLPAGDRAGILAAYETEIKRNLAPITEDSMPGELANVVAGRIANALNFGGPNFTTDAACAGSMAAMQAAVKGLQDGEFDLAVTGGADRSMGVATYAKFCKIGALSPDGSRPFDAGANGFVMGEGVGILVLKRLSDAVRDHDRVYAVIRGFGASSDGKGKGITAPNPEGQRRALQRAYQNAGIDPWDVDLFECHGTSTVVGDKVEVDALSELVGSGRRARPVRIGSIKSNIGHLKSAAGAASALKATLALHHGVYPPTINYRTPRPDLDLSLVPLKVQTTSEAWESARRFCGVSSFGFGGTNFHMVLEAFSPGMASAGTSPRSRISPSGDVYRAPELGRSQGGQVVGHAPGAPAPTSREVERAGIGAVPVPEGLWALSADTPEELIARCEALSRGQGSPFEPDAPLRVAGASADVAERAIQLEKVVSALRKGKGYDLLRQRGIAFEDVPCDGQLAFLFTGQGSQYVDMGLDLAAHYPIVADTFREADEVMAPLLGKPLTDYIRRDPSLTEDDQFERLRDTEISQPATLTVDVAILRLLASFGVRPDVVAGHSLGEYGAAVAAGILSFRDALTAVSARGREMAAVQLDDKGKMAGIAAGVETVMEVLAEVPGYVVPANKNCPAQTVIAGESDAVEAASELFKSRGITVYPLPVSHAFHSRIVAPASEPLKRVLEQLDVQPPRRRVTTNVDSRYYPTGEGARDKIINNLARQVAAPVEWIAQVERMYNDGARIFVECGPKRALSGFVVQILKHRPHRALYTNQPKRGGVLAFLDALAGLFALGFPVGVRPDRTADLFAEGPPRRSTSLILAGRGGAGGEAVGGALGVSTPEVERHILQIVAQRTGHAIEALDMDHDVEADLGIDTVKLADIIAQVRERLRIEHDPSFQMGQYRTLRQLSDYAARRIGAVQPASTPTRRAAIEAWAASGTAQRGQPAVVHVGAPSLPPDAASRFLAEIAGKNLHGMDGGAFAQAMLPALQGFLGAAWVAFEQAHRPAPAANAPPPIAPSPANGAASAASTGNAVHTESRPTIVCSGASLGLPGGAEVFEVDGIRRILRGENRIEPIPDMFQDAIIAKNLVRVTKDPKTGEGGFAPVETREQVIRLAGRRSHFDLADYGIEASVVRTLDIATQLAFAAGLEALKDASIPLVRTYRETSNGKRVATGWALPECMRDDTGIVFGSAFAGYDQLVDKIKRDGDDGEGHFDRRFLFQVLAMGHSQFAQLVGARGPNAAVNAACASTTQAIAVAEDWILSGRCERVIVLGCDDVTSDTLLEWIGAGFLAAGAATTTAKVEDAALPFDKRRHGMILGMGAVGLVIETAAAAASRGTIPIAKLLGTHLANSAFHGTRLDAEHIAREVKRFADRVVQRAGVSHATFAEQCVFLSHETYTPARGGSAAAEMASLPHAFGPSASRMIIANTKGFTGHPMGAGIEDTVAVKALQYREVPPIPNLKEPDPDLGQLTLSKGGHYDVKYALRLAAGFGSQLALSALEGIARGDERVSSTAVQAAWLRAQGGGSGTLVIEKRQLRWVVEAAAPRAAAVSRAAAFSPEAAVSREAVAAGINGVPAASPSGPAAAAGPGVTPAAVLAKVRAVVAAKTGYGIDEIEPSYELEADLGVDTVKQAEIFAEVRDAYGLARDDSFKLADYPTVEKLASWLAGKVAESTSAAPGAGAPADAPNPTFEQQEAGFPGASTHQAPAETQLAAPSTRTQPPASQLAQSPADGAHFDAVLAKVVSVVAAKTGYEPGEIDPAYELEADLGIDTVKQAEIFAEVRDAYGLARDDSFKLADYPTVEKLARWLAGKAGTVATAPTASQPPSPDTSSQPAVADSPLSEPEAAPDDVLPPNFRVRRVIRVSHVNLPVGTLRGQVVWVLGGSDLALALRDEVERAGARTEGEPDVVVECGMPVLEGFAQARRLDSRRPRQWVTVLAPSADLRDARDAGARAGLCKALGREWPECRARVVSLAAGLGIADAARSVIDELGEADRATEVWVGPGVREVAALAVAEVPATREWPNHPIVLLSGGTRGITAQVALAIARRGPCTLLLVSRTAPSAVPLDEDRERARIKGELSREHKKVTPKMVDDQLRGPRVADEARRNVEAMRALGATVEISTVDLADAPAVRALVDRLRNEHPRIDLVVHGAGVEESRQLADKDERAFSRVFDGKAEGGLALVESIDTSTFFVSMGSIAGRFGNAGQVDYAAANEAMAQVCLLRPRSLHVCWTAWGGVGMAVRGGMEQLLTSRGVELLPAVAGANLLCEMVAAGVSGEVVVAGALGDFQSPALHPLLDTIELVGDKAIARRALSLTTDDWMADHAIDGVPVLPGVIGLEMMIGTALAANPRGRYAGVEDVRFAAPLKLHRDEPVDVEITAEPEPGGGYRATLKSTRRLRSGRSQETMHFEGCIQLDEMPLLPALPSAFFPDERISQKDIYRRFFHGQRFQVLRSAEAVAVQGMLAEAVVEHAPIAEGLVSDPLVLESAFQAAGLHGMALSGIMALPAQIDAVELVRSAVEGEVLQIVVHHRNGVYDIDVDGSEGRVMRVRGFKMVEKGPLPPELRFPVPAGGWPSAALAASSEAATELPPSERAQLESRGTPKRKSDRIAGQLAANRAVAGLVGDDSFRVVRDEGGKPVVVGPVDVEVSITHVGGEAIAMAVRGAHAGIDMEPVEPRSDAFANEWLSEAERAWATDDRARTVVWSVKEAVLKALGVGMALNPRQVEVLGVDDPVRVGGKATVRLSGDVAARHAELGGKAILVRVGELGGRVVATAVFAA